MFQVIDVNAHKAHNHEYDDETTARSAYCLLRADPLVTYVQLSNDGRVVKQFTRKVSV